MGRRGSRTIGDDCRHLLKGTSNQVEEAFRAVTAPALNVTAGTSHLNEQLLTSIHPPPVKVRLFFAEREL
jgi:hypothetical protein